MKDFKSLTADDILNIPQDCPERLFSVDGLKEELRRIWTIWHPDRCTDPKADAVFQHVQILREKAEEKIRKDLWDGPSELVFLAVKGGTYRFKYRRVSELEIGRMYVGRKHIAYVIKPEFEDLFRNGINMINKIKYPAKKFEEQFKRQVPIIVKSIEANIGFVVVVEKTEDLVLLKDLLEYLPNHKLPPVHVAWVLSTLCNFACFLEMNNIAHGAISTNTYWVTPKHHSGVLLGGWWYSRPEGAKLLALPSESISILPKEIFVDKVGKSLYDRMLIKTIGLELLGDKSRTGSTLLKDTSVPKSVLSWLRSPPAPTAVEEYKRWGNARDTGFGPRKFHDLVVDINQIY